MDLPDGGEITPPYRFCEIIIAEHIITVIIKININIYLKLKRRTHLEDMYQVVTVKSFIRDFTIVRDRTKRRYVFVERVNCVIFAIDTT